MCCTLNMEGARCCDKSSEEYRFHISGTEFDVLKIPQSSLQDVAVEIISQVVAQENLSVDWKELRCFVKCVRNHYGNPEFHNFYHAVSVMQALAELIKESPLFSGREKLLLLILALAHDAGHVGLTNGYLATSFEEIPKSLVKKYGSLSAMEKHHVELAFQLLRSHPKLLKCIVGGDLGDAAEISRISDMIVYVILCTDLSVHDKLLDKHSSKHAKKLECASLAMHAADLSNAARPFSANVEWSLKLRRERAQEQPSQHEFDGLAMEEVSFIDGFILPTWANLSRVLDESIVQPWLDALIANRDTWATMDQNWFLGLSTQYSSDINEITEFYQCDTEACEIDCNTSGLRLPCTKSFIIRASASKICTAIEKKQDDPTLTKDTLISNTNAYLYIN